MTEKVNNFIALLNDRFIKCMWYLFAFISFPPPSFPFVKRILVGEITNRFGFALIP